MLGYDIFVFSNYQTHKFLRHYRQKDGPSNTSHLMSGMTYKEKFSVTAATTKYSIYDILYS